MNRLEALVQMRKALAGGLIALALMAALPAMTMAAEPTSVSGVCFAGSGQPVAIPMDGRAPSVWFGYPNYVGPLGIAPLFVFNRTGGCTFTPQS